MAAAGGWQGPCQPPHKPKTAAPLPGLPPPHLALPQAALQRGGAVARPRRLFSQAPLVQQQLGRLGFVVAARQPCECLNGSASRFQTSSPKLRSQPSCKRRHQQVQQRRRQQWRARELQQAAHGTASTRRSSPRPAANVHQLWPIAACCCCRCAAAAARSCRCRTGARLALLLAGR